MANSQGSGFTNIQNILNANQNNQLGNAVGGGVLNQANQAKQNLNTIQQGFNQNTQQQLQNYQNDYQNVNQVLQNPTQASDQDVANFAQYRSGQYNGPTDLGDISSLQNQANNAEQLGKASQTTGGRLSLLQRFAGGGGQYNSGEQQLDNILLGQQANNNLAQARRVTTGLTNQVNQAQQNAQAVGQTLQGQAQNLANTTNTAIQNQQNPLLSQLSQTAQQAQAQKNSDAARIQQELKTGTLTSADAQLLGLQNGMNISDVDLTQFLNVNPTQANQQNVANTQQTATLNALAKLAGQQQFGDPTQAGTFNQNQFAYNTSGLQNAVNNQMSAYNSAINPLNGQISGDAQKAQGVFNNLLNASIFNFSAKPWIADKIQQDTGVNIRDPNGMLNLANAYRQDLANPQASNYGKNFREGTLGGLSGPDRDAIVGALQDIINQQNQITGLQSQFGVNNTLQVT